MKLSGCLYAFERRLAWSSLTALLALETGDEHSWQLNTSIISNSFLPFCFSNDCTLGSESVPITCAGDLIITSSEEFKRWLSQELDTVPLFGQRLSLDYIKTVSIFLYRDFRSNA